MCSVPMRTITKNDYCQPRVSTQLVQQLCFKFKPVAPNITGCAARERHTSGIVIHLVQYGQASTRKYSPGIFFLPSSSLVCKTSLNLVYCQHRYIQLPLLSENAGSLLSRFALFLLSAHCSFFQLPLLRITNSRFDTLLQNSLANILITRTFYIVTILLSAGRSTTFIIHTNDY